jgi:uncharacterized protein
LGRQRGYQHIIYGVNHDDLGDYRPGQGAAKLHQVAAPLADAGLTKAEICELSRRVLDTPGFHRIDPTAGGAASHRAAAHRRPLPASLF